MRITRAFFTLQTFYILLLINSIIACNNPGTKPGNGKETHVSSTEQLIFDRLIGTWQNKDGKSFERWTKNDNGTYLSEGFSVNGNDTSWNERASVYREENKWVFENTVKNQNDGKAIKFTSTALTENSVQFSNPAHDFPTDINYTLANATTLRAFIAGPNNKGETDTIPFTFIKLK